MRVTSDSIREHLQVEHHLRGPLERCRNAARPVAFFFFIDRELGAAIGLSSLNAALDVTHRLQVLGQPRPVVASIVRCRSETLSVTESRMLRRCAILTGVHADRGRRLRGGCSIDQIAARQIGQRDTAGLAGAGAGDTSSSAAATSATAART